MACLSRLVMSYFDPAKCGSPDDVDCTLECAHLLQLVCNQPS